MNNDLPSTNPEASMSSFDLSKNDSYLMSATGGMISIFDMTTFKTMKKVMPPPPAATCLAFHPEMTVTWNLEGHAKRVTSLAFSNTLNVLVSSESDSPYIVQTKRNTPLTGSSGVLKLSSPGILVPVDHKNTTGDTLIPGMKLVRNKITCFNWHLTLWKNPQDPSQGHYAYQLGPYGYHKLILREGSVIKYRTAPWNGIQFSGMHNLNPTYDFALDNDDEVYYGYKLLNSSTLFRLALIQDGFGLSYIGSDGNQGWVVYLRATTDICDKYGISGSKWCM
ncbi:hypothetical protein L3X38_001172 [Prunus dulcis]|uniref:S-locus glycoprotein domain-containing protein n=1 Tax=Prunus dulcis TaxID=3755 RepID=A0AAD4WRK3_PRUDU|nr:hypothetical protein L3X38_001172 [Prunus dulcis]